MPFGTIRFQDGLHQQMNLLAMADSCGPAPQCFQHPSNFELETILDRLTIHGGPLETCTPYPALRRQYVAINTYGPKKWSHRWNLHPVAIYTKDEVYYITYGGMVVLSRLQLEMIL